MRLAAASELAAATRVKPRATRAKPDNPGANLTPVNDEKHSQLLQSGYKHTANYEPTSGTGRFGYYENPTSGHKLILDQMGNLQDQPPEKPWGAQKAFRR
jgi:hypothetical protein